ncbi:PucR family transcriptional regulator [Saccharopolyspora hirsuta]|uniref:PucR family transcriptional regulator n=1 Tax=Saccharopolyspora hirsuta TaxID=1837 RepID=UPI001FE75405|nr:PucR family transcriptional regulator [Saccharopolyspora hirsuta]
MLDPPSSTPVGYDSLTAPAHADAGRARRLWELLPSGLAGVFRPKVADVTGEVVREIQQSLPEYTGRLEGEFGSTVALGVQQAIHHFLDRLGNPAQGHEDRSRVFYQLGRHEMQQGRSLDMLQRAYRVGARIAWRRTSSVGIRAGIPVSTLCLLAEAIFAYIDELSALSIAGYTAAQAEATGTLQRRRRRLLDLILASPPSAPHVLAECAESARWPLPDRVVAVALEPVEDDAAVPALGDGVLVNFEDAAPCLVAPHRSPVLAQGVPGWHAAVGPATQIRHASDSLRCARRALDLARHGVLPSAPVLHCDQHLLELCLFDDPLLLGELVSATLAPLAPLAAKQQRKLSETLLVWLEARGNVREVAQRLSLHPQTVRSRLQQLEDLFGPRLQDPLHRFDLMLALRARRSTD